MDGSLRIGNGHFIQNDWILVIMNGQSINMDHQGIINDGQGIIQIGMV